MIIEEATPVRVSNRHQRAAAGRSSLAGIDTPPDLALSSTSSTAAAFAQQFHGRVAELVARPKLTPRSPGLPTQIVSVPTGTRRSAMEELDLSYSDELATVGLQAVDWLVVGLHSTFIVECKAPTKAESLSDASWFSFEPIYQPFHSAIRHIGGVARTVEPRWSSLLYASHEVVSARLAAELVKSLHDQIRAAKWSDISYFIGSRGLRDSAPELILAFLRGSQRWRKKIDNWDGLLNRAKEEFDRRGLATSKLLRGL